MRGDKMKSDFLNKLGIINYTSGVNYDFKYLNAGSSVKDYMDEILRENSINPVEIYSAVQTHSTNIAGTDSSEFKNFIFGKNIDNTDGIITDKKGEALVIKYADCTPIILFDSNKKILAALHSGWRGTAERISEKAVNIMISEYGSDPENIYAYIGPSVDSDLYEVGEDVYDAFKNFRYRDMFFNYKGHGKYLLDMKGINKSILLDRGILNRNIHISEKKTLSDLSFHSARREGPGYGLNMTLVMM